MKINSIHEFCVLGDRRAPSHVDWEIARTCIKFLEPFYSETLEIPDNLQVTSNLFLYEPSWIHDQLQSESDNKDSHLKNMADHVREKYSKYWEDMDSVSPLLFVAGFLYPRFKDKALKCTLAPICGDLLANEITKKARKTLDELYELYSTLYPASEKDGMEVNELEKSFRIYQKQRDKKMGLKSEVDKYFKQSWDTEYVNFNVLDWWKAHSGIYRVLAKTARDVLAIPYSTRILESTFDSGGKILNSSMHSSSSETVEALVCTRNWLSSCTEEQH